MPVMARAARLQKKKVVTLVRIQRTTSHQFLGLRYHGISEPVIAHAPLNGGLSVVLLESVRRIHLIITPERVSLFRVHTNQNTPPTRAPHSIYRKRQTITPNSCAMFRWIN